ncbi:10840_t:CDS:2, partial [Acaulospora morrowiae]
MKTKGGRQVALRILDYSRYLDSEFLKEPKLEFLFTKKHRRINRFHGISQDPTTMNHILVMSYRPVDSKVYLQANFTKITWFNKREILNIIALRIMSLHRWNIIHQNLHSEIIDQATKKFYMNDYQQFQNAEEKRKQMIDSGTSFVKEPGQNHPKSVYHARSLNIIIEIANAIKNSRDLFNFAKPSASENSSRTPKTKKHQKQNYFRKVIMKKSITSSNNQAKSILEWIPYEDFSNIDYIGIGGFSKVYKATWHKGHIKRWNLLTGEVVRSKSVEVALKVLHDSTDINSTFLNELQFLHLFKSNELEYRHIVKCYGVSQDPETKNYIFVMQYANYGNLRKLLATEFSDRVNWSLKKRDLHSGNILVSTRKKNVHISLISDLGLSQPVNKKSESIHGVIPYMAPENFDGKYLTQSDIYSLGMIRGADIL